MVEKLLIANVALSFLMIGVIWFVQVVQYPMFSSISSDDFAGFHENYRRRISVIVGPAMMAELAVALSLAFFPPDAISASATVSLVLLVAAWLSTILLQIPLHNRLARGYDARAISILVVTNWIRTVVWSARGAIAIDMLMSVR